MDFQKAVLVGGNYELICLEILTGFAWISRAMVAGGNYG